MKNIFYIIAISLSLQTASAFAGEQECQQAYSDTVSFCAQNLKSLPPGMRAGAQKGCVEDAKVAKDYCSSGGNSCQTNCQATYTSAVSACEINNDPEICGFDLICQSIILQRRSDCINNATIALNTCALSCQ